MSEAITSSSTTHDRMEELTLNMSLRELAAMVVQLEQDAIGGPAVSEELQNRIAELERQLEAQRQAYERAEFHARSSESELLSFRDQVREVAIRVAGENGWCDSGLNEVLDELGLDPKTSTWLVEVEVTARQTRTVSVEAVSEEAAQDQVVQNEDEVLSSEIDSYDWEWDSDDVEIQSVSHDD